MTADMTTAEYSAQVARTMSEATFQSKVIEWLNFYGWKWFHVHDSRRSNPGWPDISAARGDRLIFMELKAHKGRISKEQQDWHCMRPRSAWCR